MLQTWDFVDHSLQLPDPQVVLPHWPPLPFSFSSQTPWDMVYQKLTPIHSLSHSTSELPHIWPAGGPSPWDWTAKHAPDTSTLTTICYSALLVPVAVLVARTWPCIWSQASVLNQKLLRKLTRNSLTSERSPTSLSTGGCNPWLPGHAARRQDLRARLSSNTVWQRYRSFRRSSRSPAASQTADFLTPSFFFIQPTLFLSLPKLQFKAKYTLNRPE